MGRRALVDLDSITELVVEILCTEIGTRPAL
jgi:phage baseplate assembly protein W